VAEQGYSMSLTCTVDDTAILEKRVEAVQESEFVF